MGKGEFTVRVTTKLNSDAKDESFGIDNVKLAKAAAPTVCKAPKYINKDKKCVACPKGSTCDGKTATACKSPKVVKANKCVAATFKTITANFANVKDQQGWNCGKIQKCGSIGNVCGGYGTKGAKHDIKKTFTKLPAGTYQISLDFIKIDSWDNEKAIVKVNGKQCWTKTFTGVQGKQICGSKSTGWNELKQRATCTANAVNGQFTVLVTTTPNSGAGDESFGIDNVVFSKA